MEGDVPQLEQRERHCSKVERVCGCRTRLPDLGIAVMKKLSEL